MRDGGQRARVASECNQRQIDTSVTMLGQTFPHPVFVSPMGSDGLVHPEGEVATAHGAAKSGGLLCVSSASTQSMEDISKASQGPKWFQMYVTVDEGESREVLERVRIAGFKAVILTIDAIGQGSSDEYVRLGRNRPWLPYGNFPTGKALALGANAVAVGRPVWWALTVGGAGGVGGLMNCFQSELVNTMLHCGVDKISALGREHVRPAERQNSTR